jgi:hypothetical protein
MHQMSDLIQKNIRLEVDLHKSRLDNEQLQREVMRLRYVLIFPLTRCSWNSSFRTALEESIALHKSSSASNPAVPPPPSVHTHSTSLSSASSSATLSGLPTYSINIDDYNKRFSELIKLQRAKAKESLRAEHPHLRYIDKQDWSDGKSVGSEFGNKVSRYAFLEDKDGHALSASDLSDVAQDFTNICKTLHHLGLAAKSWGSVSGVGQAFVLLNMVDLHPCFLLCSGIWKLHEYATRKYPDFADSQKLSASNPKRKASSKVDSSDLKKAKIDESQLSGLIASTPEPDTTSSSE